MKKNSPMPTNSGLSNELIGMSPSELEGSSVEEIEFFIRMVQDGLMASEPRMTDQQIKEAAQKIYNEANQ